MTKNIALIAALIPLLASAVSAQTNDQPNGDAEITGKIKSISSIPGKFLAEAPRGDAEIVSSGSSQAKADGLSIVIQAHQQVAGFAAAARKSKALDRTKKRLDEIEKAAAAVSAEAQGLSAQLEKLKGSPRISGTSDADVAKASLAKAEALASGSEWDGHDRAHSDYDYELMMNTRYGNMDAAAGEAAVEAAMADVERMIIETRALAAAVTKYLASRGAIEPCSCAQIKSDAAAEIAAKKPKWDKIKKNASELGVAKSFIFEASTANSDPQPTPSSGSGGEENWKPAETPSKGGGCEQP